MTTMQIPLPGSRFALIDEADYPLVCRYRWTCSSTDGKPYATTGVRRHDGRIEHLKMHRIITRAYPGRQVDHINMDTLDNRRRNLRTATKAQNMHNRNRTRANTSGYKGVHWHKGGQKWMAEIKHNGTREYLGLFETAEAAARAYDEAAFRLHGKYARPNFPRERVQVVTTPAEAAA